MSVIGDHRGLLRSLRYYKAFATYNMVLIHAVSIMHPLLVPLGYVSLDHVRGSMLRGMFSMTLPALGGFYFRHLLGPYLIHGRISVNLWPQLRLLLLAVFGVEALRLFTITFDLGHVFSWQVLHFIGISVIATYICLRRGSGLLLIFLGVTIGLSFLLPPFADELAQAHWTRNPVALRFATGLITLAFGGLVGAIFHWWKSSPLIFSIGFVLGSGLMFFLGTGNEDNLRSFLLLPVSIFTYVPGTRNYWPFMSFFPLFLSGYFLRGFLFNPMRKPWIWPLTGAFLLSGLLGFHFGFFGVDAGTTHAFSAEVFRRGFFGSLFFIAVFYVSWGFFYFLLKGGRFRSFDKAVTLGGNVLTIYLTHTLLFVLLRELLLEVPGIFPVSWGLWGLYLVLHLVYGFSVILSYNLVKLYNRLRGI